MGKTLISLALFSLLLLFSPLLCASGFANAEKIPYYYSYSWSRWALNPASPEGVTQVLGISGANSTNKKVLEALNQSEKKYFEKSLMYFKESDAELNASRGRLERASLFRLFRDPLATTWWAEFWMLEFVDENNAIDHALNALSKAANGVNEAVIVIDEDMDKLEQAGAGYKNYTGKASGAYAELAEAMKAMDEGSTEGSGFGNKYAKSLLITSEISAEVSKGSVTLPYGNLADAIELLSGSESSVFFGISKAHRDSIEALAFMEEEYGQFMQLCDSRKKSVGEEMSRMAADGYGQISEELVLQFYEGNSSWGKASTPAQYLSQTDLLLNGRSFSGGAEKAFGEAKGIVRKKSDGYLALGIEKAGECVGKTREAETKINEAGELVAVLKQHAEGLVLEKERTAKGAIDGFSPKTPEEQVLYDEALAKYGLAERNIELAKTAKSGDALEQYSASLALYKEVFSMLSGPKVYAENMTGKAKDAIESLRESIKKANTDGIDAPAENEYADSASVLV
ncbi:MAG: hypothetical protein V1909_06515, partial [Candidatus Micrarchaeota archaeon]